jgi:hypothetical protein
MRTIFAITLLIAAVGLLMLSAWPRAAGSSAAEPAGSGTYLNVTADLVLGQDDLVHNQRNLVNSA